MNKWEITGGKKFSWKASQHWWIMTWIINGSTKQCDFSPTLVLWMPDDILLIPYAPAHAREFGNPKEVAGPAGGRMHYITPNNVWARMPAQIPAVPNVDMFFEVSPFDEEKI